MEIEFVKLVDKVRVRRDITDLTDGTPIVSMLAELDIVDWEDNGQVWAWVDERKEAILLNPDEYEPLSYM